MSKNDDKILGFIEKDSNQTKKKLLPIAVLVLAAVGMIVLIVWLMTGKDEIKNNGVLPTDNSGLIEEGTEDITPTGTEDDPDVSEEGHSTTEPGLSPGEPTDIVEPSDNDSHVPEEDQKVEVPSVEVAPVEDQGDPQVESGKGAEISVGELDPQEETAQVITYGIDVAKWQGVIDWAKVKESGVEFAMIRVGYRTLVDGEIYEDPYAKYNLQEAKANGVKIGVYFFSTAVNRQEAKEEAAWVASYIAPYPITYPVAYNCEGFTNSDNRQYGMSKEARTDLAIAFLDYVKKQGYAPMFYASKNELQDSAQWDTERLSNKYKIWVAQYPQEAYTSTSKSTFTGEQAMWQYTSQGKVPGIKGEVDINIAYFGFEDVKKAKDESPQEEVDADPFALITFKEVNEKVTAKIKTNLRTVPSTADPKTVYAELTNGATAIRTGVGSNGWSRLEYKGKVLYAVSSYLTTNLETPKPTPTPTPTEAPIKGPLFREVNETVTAKKETNLRSEPSTDNTEIITVLKYGDIAVRTGVGENGWSRVEYDGKTLYAVTSYLTTDLEYQKEKITPTLEEPEAGIVFTGVKEQVTAKEVTNLRLIPSSDGTETVAASLTKGDIAVRTGLGNNGWSRVEYNGQTLYAVSSFLTVVEDTE